MKKLLFALSVILLTACSSNDVIEDTPVDNSKTYPVTFSVSNFTSEIQDLRSASIDYTGLKAYYLLITNKDSVYVAAIEKRDLTDLSSLEDIQVELPKGKYTAYSILMDNWDAKGEPNLPMTGEFGYLGKSMSGSYAEFYGITELIQSYTYALDGTTYNYEFPVISPNLQTMQYDYFYKKTDFVVDENGATVSQVLPRITGKVEFHFTDIEPLENSVYSEDMYYAFVYLDAMSGVNLKNEDYAGVGSPGFYLTRKQWSELAEKPLSIYTRGTDDQNRSLLIKIIDPTKPFKALSFKETDNDSNLKDKYIIRNIKVVENKKTIMTGALDKPSGFQISVDDTWGDDINIDF